MKKILIYFLPIILVFVYLFFFTKIFRSAEPKPHTDSRMDTVDLYIKEGRIDSAFSLLQKIISDPGDAQTYDSALSLQLQIQKIVLLDFSGSHIDVLLQLTGEEYESLLNHTLKKQFLSNPVLNEYYVRKLYEKSLQNQENSDSPPPGDSKLDANQLRDYAAMVRKTYADLGFEITVRVIGKDSNELVLQSPVFNDTWYTKFDSGGDLEAWHSLGFMRVQIENGSGYVRAKEWDHSDQIE